MKRKWLNVFRYVVCIVGIAALLGYYLTAEPGLKHWFLGVMTIFLGLIILLNPPSFCIKSTYLKLAFAPMGLVMLVYGILGLLRFHDLTQKIWEKGFYWKAGYILAILLTGLMFLPTFISWVKKRKKKDNPDKN